MVWSLACFWTWPGRTPTTPLKHPFLTHNRPLHKRKVQRTKNHAQTKKTQKTEKNEKPSPEAKMHRTVAKTLLHSSLATGTSNGQPVVLQKKNVQKDRFCTLKPVLFGPPKSAPAPNRTHKTNFFLSRALIPHN